MSKFFLLSVLLPDSRSFRSGYDPDGRKSKIKKDRNDDEGEDVEEEELYTQCIQDDSALVQDLIFEVLLMIYYAASCDYFLNLPLLHKESYADIHIGKRLFAIHALHIATTFVVEGSHDFRCRG